MSRFVFYAFKFLPALLQLYAWHFLASSPQEKGYGFITPDEGGEDIFVHYTGIAGSGFRTLEEGERVSYEPTRGRKGEQAANVRKV